METERNIDKLAGHLMNLGVAAAIIALCLYFHSVLIYIILAFIVSLIGQPLTVVLRKVRINGRTAPDWLLAILAIICILGGILLIVTQIIPVVTGIVRDASLFKNIHMPEGNLIDNVNQWIAGAIPWLGADFDGVGLVLGYAKDFIAKISLTGILGSLASTMVDFIIGGFSVAFIAFFFIKDNQLFSKIIGALTPDRLEKKVGQAIGDIERLLSRYFVGLIIEMFGVALINFLGLWLIARIGFGYAVGIAFIAGILNIIPYIGPLIGEILGVTLCFVLKYGSGTGLDVNIWFFALLVLLIMFSAQMIDNFIYQPLIYSKSIQATPLEVFIVILLAAHIGGVTGMLAAIPAYTVIRVIAGRFFYGNKAVQRLMPDMKNEVNNNNNNPF